MSDDAQHPQLNGRQAGRVQLRLREQGVLEGHLSIGNGQALTPFLANGKDSVVLSRTIAVQNGHEADQVTMQSSEIIWAKALDPRIPLIHITALHTDYRSVELVISGGEVLRGHVAVFKGQSVADLVANFRHFLPLWRVHALVEGVRLGDVAVNRAAIEAVREVAETEIPPEPQAPAASLTLHWLVKVARQLKLAGSESIALDPGAPITQVWSVVASAAGMDQDALANAVAHYLKIQTADLTGVDTNAWDAEDTFAERYGVRVLRDDGRTLTVATADPMNADTEQALAFAAKRRIAFVLASPHTLRLTDNARPQQPEAELEALLASVTGSTASVIRLEDEPEPQEIEIEDVSSEPVIKLANLILREAVRQNASDIHLEPDQSRGIVRFRVDGVLRPYMHIPLAALNRVISRFKVTARLDIANRVRPQDGRIRVRVDGQRFELRLSTVPTQDSEKAVLRLAGSVQEQTLEQLDISAPELQALRNLLSHRDGVVVVTGPTGSGKTTTLYGALHELNTGRVNIMTVEDPVERALSGATQIQVQSNRGVTFASALRAILRQDPDIILVGEIRDLETAEIAVQAAMTGHLVLTTLHTTSAVGVVNRLTDLGLDRTTLAAALRGVVAQRLARRSCRTCGGSGCSNCEGVGYRGRLPVMEVLNATPQFTELVGRGAGFHELQRAAIANGMRPIRMVADERVLAGETTAEEIIRVLGTVEDEVRAQEAAAGCLPPPTEPTLPSEGVTGGLMRLPGAAQEGVSGLPAPLGHASGVDLNSPAQRRAQSARALLQGLDRCIAEGQALDEVMRFACEQLSAAFDSPLVWIGTVDDGSLSIRARAGACAPYVNDIVAQWADLESGDGAVATAWRTGEPQARHLEQEPGFDSWREYARAYGLPIFLAVPMEGQNGAVGIVGVHARSVEGLDQQAGSELVSLVDRITGALERVRHLEAVSIQLSALESAADSVFTTDRRGVIQWVNRSFCQLTGYTPSEVVGKLPNMLRSDHHDAAFYKGLWDTILSGQSWRGELYNRRKDGEHVVVEQTITPVANAQGEITYFLSVQRDISERKQREAAVQTLVNHDVPTGLPNARALDAELNRAIAAAGHGSECSLLLIHVSGSAALRDTAGDAVADALISGVAEVLKATLRPGDYLARLGDDEFAALLPGTPAEGSVIAADRLRSAVARHAFDVPQLSNPLSINIGIASIDGSQGSRAVLAMADSALYGTRDRTESIVVSQISDMDDRDAAGWGTRIKDALREDQFFLHFQPVVRLSNHTVSHFDALIRLHDEDGDVIPARAFISHAERLGMIAQLDRWVVENVLRLLHVSPDLRVALNLSAATVVSTPFRQFLQKQSRSLSAVAGRIIFEVGEVAAVQNLAKVQDSMNKLTELGCCFALDNFGIGGASLASLGTLPVDYVKLDGSLIRSIDRDQEARELVQALTAVARALGKEVIAGWAERESIVELLPRLGIGLAQGHHLGRPSRELRHVPAESSREQQVAAALATAHAHQNGNGKLKRLAV